MKRRMSRSTSRGEQSTGSASQKRAESKKTVQFTGSDKEEGDDADMQGIVAIQDPHNACGGPKMGLWAEVGHFTSRVKPINVKFFHFSQQDMQKMEKGEIDQMQTEAWIAAACYIAPSKRGKSESPVKMPGQNHGGKQVSSTQVTKTDDYAIDFKQHDGERKARGAAKKGRSCWVLFDFGVNTNPPKHHIFNSWDDTREE